MAWKLRIRKRDGTLQEFDKQKLRASLEKAGASGVDAINIAYRVGARVREGTTSQEIRDGVTTELIALNETVAQTYSRHGPKILSR